jgi:hypothetical protein
MSLVAGMVEFAAAVADNLSGSFGAARRAERWLPRRSPPLCRAQYRRCPRSSLRSGARPRLCQGNPTPPAAGHRWKHIGAYLGTAADFLKFLIRERLSDVYGMDLISACFTDVGVLVGVTWTDDTTWPPQVASWFRAQSRKTRPGVYLVLGGGMWKQADALVDA